VGVFSLLIDQNWPFLFLFRNLLGHLVDRCIFERFGVCLLITEGVRNVLGVTWLPLDGELTLGISIGITISLD
jgi:hypothetical protein